MRTGRHLTHLQDRTVADVDNALVAVVDHVISAVWGRDNASALL